MKDTDKRSLFVFGCIFLVLVTVRPAWYFWAICAAAALVTLTIAALDWRDRRHG